ncbi:MAG: hypothetical protein ACT6S0_20120 [Roseateles sp.]|uniref:hypothetical protein n=1 Tax=Roseateles sp. TaxID=1971397 RepID=UPI0040367793
MLPLKSITPLAVTLLASTAALSAGVDGATPRQKAIEPTLHAAEPVRWDGVDRQMLKRIDAQAGKPAAPKFPAEIR